MTPGARVQAAIEILDAIVAGAPAERALTRWARASRFAGSKDRAAVRDHVFEALRCWRSHAALGGGTDGRARMIGQMRAQQVALDPVFSGQGHAPAVLTEAERLAARAPDDAEARDFPDWLWPALVEGRGVDGAHAEALALRQRAPVDLRVNLLRATREEASARLAADGIEAIPHALAPTALRVVHGARRVAQSASYRDGLVELQDAASQAVVAQIPLKPGMRVLDYCAGGGGKALAMAAQLRGPVVAHDALPQRLRDLPRRAARAGARIEISDAPHGPFDVVLCDVPCSGSGAWRRAPEGKWRLTPATLDETLELQREILATAQGLVGAGGVLVYATCSLLHCENGDQTERFCALHPSFRCDAERAFCLGDGGDGLYVAVLTQR